MASDVRIGVTLACEECKRRNYETNKSRRNSPDRIEIRPALPTTVTGKLLRRSLKDEAAALPPAKG